MPLSFSYFYIRIQFAVRKYRGCSYTVDRPVNGVKSHFGYWPLLYYKFGPISHFRGHGSKALLRESIILGLKTQSIRESVCRIYPGKREVYIILGDVIAFIYSCASSILL